MSTTKPQDFGKLRSFFWPVHGFELKKVLPMFFMLFCINFNYTVLRDMKDAIVINAPGSDAGIIPFLKLGFVVPAAILFMIAYMKLSNTLSKRNLFYATIAPFLIFFTLYAVVLAPNAELLSPTTSADWLEAQLPAGYSGLVAVYRNWTSALFYIAAELWGSAILSLLFWGFANDITRVSEAKRFYTLFLLGANVAMLVSGPLITKIASVDASVPGAWQTTLNQLMGIVVFMGISVMLLYRYVHESVLTDTRFYDPKDVKKKKSKMKMGIGDSIKFLAKSPYLAALGLLVVGYGMSINLVEVIWKSQLKEMYPSKNEYLAFMGQFSFFTGAATIGMLLFVGGNVIRRFGWGVAATVTPTVLLITGLSFFSFMLFRDSNAVMGLVVYLGTSPLYMAVILGAAQNIMSKSSKYSLFDPTKEMAYIPLDDESKTKGKAAIDVVGGRLGKSGGSLMYWVLLAFMPSVTACTPIVAVIVTATIVGWLFAVHFLNGQFVALTSKQDAEASAQETAEGAIKVDPALAAKEAKASV